MIREHSACSDLFPTMFPPVIFCAITGEAIITTLSAAIIATIMKICFEFIARIDWVYYIRISTDLSGHPTDDRR
jgi:hypothetical protein